jgi:hypothetical protein
VRVWLVQQNSTLLVSTIGWDKVDTNEHHFYG